MSLQTRTKAKKVTLEPELLTSNLSTLPQTSSTLASQTTSILHDIQNQQVDELETPFEQSIISIMKNNEALKEHIENMLNQHLIQQMRQELHHRLQQRMEQQIAQLTSELQTQTTSDIFLKVKYLMQHFYEYHEFIEKLETLDQFQQFNIEQYSDNITLLSYKFPIEKLKPIKEGKKPAILVSCGSFSPVTIMHLRLFEMASESFTDSDEYQIIGQYMSPVGDAYNKNGLVEGLHRVEMCRLATEDSEIMIDDWEVQHSFHTPTRVVLDHFKTELYMTLKTDVKIFFICGSDLIKNFTNDNWSQADMFAIARYYGLVVIPRTSDNLESIIRSNFYLSTFAYNTIRIVNKIIDDGVSSTALRKAIGQKKSIRYFTPDSVISYINFYKLWHPKN